MNYLALCLAATTSLLSTTTLASETDPIYIGKCETTEACSLANMRKSLTSFGDNLTTYLIKNKVSNEVTHYTAEFATSEFGQDRYIVRKKGAVIGELATAVSDFVAMKENPNEGGLWNLGYTQVTFYNGIGPIYINQTKPLALETLGMQKAQMSQAIANDQAFKTNSLLNHVENASLFGSLSRGKLVTANIGGTITFKDDGTTSFGVKEGPGIYVFNGKKTADMLDITPVKLVLLDSDGKVLFEVPIDGTTPDWESLNRQFIEMNAATQTMWNNSFLKAYIDLRNCNDLGCRPTIVDPKPD